MNKTNAQWKIDWFSYIKSNKEYWRPDWTLFYLNRIEKIVYLDREITFDLLRHGADKIKPEYMKGQDETLFDHCIANFGSMIHRKILDSIKISR